MAVEGTILTIKPADAYPAAEGGAHPQFVVAAPAMRVDISRARILFANGKEEDRRGFAVAERVVVVVGDSRPTPASLRMMPNANELHFACLIERIETGDKIVTH